MLTCLLRHLPTRRHVVAASAWLAGTLLLIPASSFAQSSPGTFSVAQATYAVTQGTGSVQVIVTRAGGTSGAVGVNYGTMNGSAIAGADYIQSVGSLAWGAGDATTRTISIPLPATASYSGTKTFAVVLSSPTQHAALGTQSAATVSITGSGSTAVGVLSLAQPSYTTPQTTGSVQVVITRTGGTAAAVSVNYGTANGSAVAGVNYTPCFGMLAWGAGDSSSRTVTIPLLSAASYSGAKNFNIVLSAPGEGAILGAQSATAVWIQGTSSVGAGAFTLSQPTYVASPGPGSVQLSIQRTGGTSSAVSVNYATVNGSALANSDYTASIGELAWASGDGSSRTVTIPLLGTAPYSGAKNFVFVLSSPGEGAALGAQSASIVSIGGNSQSAGSVSGVVVTGQTASSISLSWNVAAPGANPISYYQIYRNGAFYATTGSTAYTDYGAIGATNGAFTGPATIYSYAVAAVDTAGNVGPLSTQSTFNVYYGGSMNWGGDYSYSASPNYYDTAGIPESGAYDIAVSVTGSYGGFQPYAGHTVPQWDLEAGSFAYLSMDLKPSANSQTWRLSMVSRLPQGDVFPWAGVNINNYGPTPVPGVWATYKVPLSALSVGKTSFQGSISGTTLTVNSINSGVGVDAGGFLTGPGVAPGTAIVGFNAQGGGPGTYTITPAQNVGYTTLTEQRTAVYKFDLIDETGASNNHYYIDNVKFTAQ